MQEFTTGPGNLGPVNKKLLKVIKRQTSGESNSWNLSRVSKFYFEKDGSGGANAGLEQYKPTIDWCQCSGSSAAGDPLPTLIKSGPETAVKMDYTKTWNLVGSYKNPHPDTANDIKIYKIKQKIIIKDDIKFYNNARIENFIYKSNNTDPYYYTFLQADPNANDPNASYTKLDSASPVQFTPTPAPDPNIYVFN